MTRVHIPKALHEVFGETQTLPEIALILVFGASGAAAIAVGYPDLRAPAWWQSTLAILLAFDVFAGAIANLTRGVDDFYAARPRMRWIFIAIHVHLPVAAWLLGAGLAETLVIWAYTIASATALNLMRGHATQRPLGGALFAIGAIAMLLLAPTLPPALQALSLAFMFKVIYAFAVAHGAAATPS